MLNDVAKEGKDSIVSWLPDGTGFRVHKPKDFEVHILSKYFENIKYKSFTRQLNIYCFQRISGDKKSAHYGAYWHNFFVRGKENFCLRMTRQRIKGETKTKPCLSSQHHDQSQLPSPAKVLSSPSHNRPMQIYSMVLPAPETPSFDAISVMLTKRDSSIGTPAPSSRSSMMINPTPTLEELLDDALTASLFA
jgi:hypothetical protein